MLTVQRLVHTILSWLLALVIFSIPLTLKHYVVERPYHSLYYEFTAFIVYLSDILMGVFVLATAVYHIKHRLKLQWGPLAITIPLFLLPIMAVLTAFGATDPDLANYFVVRLVLLDLFYLAIINLQPWQTAVRIGIALVVILQGGTAVLQFGQQHNLGLDWLGEVPFEAISGFAILPINQTFYIRSYGLTPHPNIVGGLLAALFMVVSIIFLDENGRLRWLWAGTAVIGFSGILFSFSRSAWLGLLVACFILIGKLATQPNTRQLALRLSLFGLVFLMSFAWIQHDLLLSRFTPRSNAQEARSLNERQSLNQITLDLIQKNPWSGVGAGQLSYHIDNYTSQYPSIEPQPAHNMPLLLTAEFGIFGGLLWLWLMLAPPIIALQQGHKGQLSLWALSLTLALLVLAITDLFDFYSWGWQQGRLLRWLLFSLWAQAIYNHQNIKVV